MLTSENLMKPKYQNYIKFDISYLILSTFIQNVKFVHFVFLSRTNWEQEKTIWATNNSPRCHEHRISFCIFFSSIFMNGRSFSFQQVGEKKFFFFQLDITTMIRKHFNQNCLWCNKLVSFLCVDSHLRGNNSWFEKF